MKKLIFILILILTRAALLLADGTEPPGSGTSGDPYLVSTLGHLLWISTNSSSWGDYFEQTTDIVATPTQYFNPDGFGGFYGFSPIGDATTHYTGTYDGQGYAIDVLYINRSAASKVGFFGYTDGATIMNLNLTNVNITGDDETGALAGHSTGSTVNNCSVTGSVSGGYYVGGIAGKISSSSVVENSSSACTVIGSDNQVGGLVGYSINSQVFLCFATGNVSGNTAVGGFLGLLSSGTLAQCYATGSVTGTTQEGGLLGMNNEGTVNDCFSTGSVAGSSNAGGLVGNNNGTVTNSFYDQETSGMSDTGQGTPKTTAEMKNHATFTIFSVERGTTTPWDFETDPYDDEGTNDYWDMDYYGLTNDGYPYLSWQDGSTVSLFEEPAGSGTSGDPWQIATLSDLLWLSTTAGTWDDYFSQTASIDASSTSTLASGAGLIPIGNSSTPFSGTYNGRGYGVSGLTIGRSDSDVGLFGYTSGATINSLHLTEVNIQGGSQVGGLIGSNTASSSVKKCFVTGTVTGPNAGGLAGLNDDALLTQCYTNATVIGSSIAGGVVAINQNSAEVNNCYARGSVTSPMMAGGVSGSNTSSAILKNCYATGSVSGSVLSGGCVANNSATVTDCFYDRNTTGQSDNTGKGTPKTTANMKLVSTFTDESTTGLTTAWDFVTDPYDDSGTDDYWDMDISDSYNSGYPFLTWQDGATGSLLSAPPGSGTSEDPYLVSTLDHLLWISKNSSSWSACFQQTANIDASGTSAWNDGAGFSSIGDATTHYTGIYDGQGYTIDGLTINRSSQDDVGFFGYINSGTVQNLVLASVDITGQGSTGGLVGKSVNTTFENCSVSGEVSGSSSVGGLTGVATNYAIISECYTQASVCCSSNTVGGLIGNLDSGSEINNCYATGSASGATQVGGLLGMNNGGTVNNCFSTSSVAGSSDAGGLVGQNSGAVTNSFYDQQTSGMSDTDRGTPKTTEEMKNFATFTDLTTSGLTTAWDFETNPNDDSGTNDYWDISCVEYDSKNSGYPYLAWQDGATVSLPSAPPGSGTSEDPYLVSTEDHLFWISKNSSCWNAYFQQTVNIEMPILRNAAGSPPIGNDQHYFSGNYNGQGYTIKDWGIVRPSQDYVGFFGYIDSGTVQNLVLKIGVAGQDMTGGLAGKSVNTIFKNCSVSGTVSGSSSVGGLAGVMDAVSCDRCAATNSVSGISYVGGLTGGAVNYAIISDCYARGSISCSSNTVGGLIGNLDSGSEINNCYATGSVSGTTGVGGLVGQNSGAVTNSFYDQQTTGQSDNTGKGTPKITANMKLVSTFTDESTIGLTTAWDFETNPYDDVRNNNFWDMDPSGSYNDGYPFLSWENVGDVSLSVGLSSFSARAESRSVVLSWTTESEMDNLGFILERSVGADDNPPGEAGTDWQTIASYQTHDELKGQGNTSSRTEYTFTDQTVESGNEYSYRLSDVSTKGEITVYASLSITMNNLPETTELEKAYPNPFNPQTFIGYKLAEDTDVNITVFDMLGRQVKTLFNGHQFAGSYNVYWNATDERGNKVPSGGYIIQMKTEKTRQTQKVMLMK